MYVKMANGEVFKELISGISASWIISCEDPGEPKLISREELDKAERVEAPEHCLREDKKHETEAQKARMEIIRPLLADDRNISDPEKRKEMLKGQALAHGTTVRRVRRLYYTYLATGILVKGRKKGRKSNEIFDRAIRKYYFSAKKNSLKTVYELMILENYTDPEGKVMENVPTLSSFSQYYTRRWSKDPQKLISRNGIYDYQRNDRMIRGSAMAFRDAIGSYQIDETMADIHLVSEYDRNTVIGRPNIYLAADTATQMITGAYVGFEAGENAVMSCIANAAMDKVSFCKELGIEITEDDWPVRGMPKELIADRGREFSGSRLEELCRVYGMTVTNQPPFRADCKPIIERNIGFIQDAYRSTLEGKGVVRDDAQERWAVDYRKQAILNLTEYKRIVVTCILTLNKSRILENIGHLPADAPNTPLELWNWHKRNGKDRLLRADDREVYIRSLPRDAAFVTRSGISVNGLRYVPAAGHYEVTFDNEKFTKQATEEGSIYQPGGTGHNYVQKSDGNNHWQECTNCKEKINVEAHKGGTATCTSKAVCEVCKAAYGEFGEHKYEQKKDADSHWQECSVCGGKTSVEAHKGGKATCTAKAVCEVCGAAYGELGDHEWVSNGSKGHICKTCNSKEGHNLVNGECSECGYKKSNSGGSSSGGRSSGSSGSSGSATSQTTTSGNSTAPAFLGSVVTPLSASGWSFDTSSNAWNYIYNNKKITNTWACIINASADGKVSADWFFFDANGSMLTGWQKINNKWYLFNPFAGEKFGACFIGPGKTYDGYIVDANGAWVEG
ncbi:MAG: hypothetical protein Q4E54_00280 [Lachnospiraceae bacterium]|nr:hypothetical protein [Lachnospiraceae bacterium]